jgi:hypothetical protein
MRDTYHTRGAIYDLQDILRLRLLAQRAGAACLDF